MNPEPLYLIVCALGCALLAIVLLAVYTGRLHHRIAAIQRRLDEAAAEQARRQQQWHRGAAMRAQTR